MKFGEYVREHISDTYLSLGHADFTPEFSGPAIFEYFGSPHLAEDEEDLEREIEDPLSVGTFKIERVWVGDNEYWRLERVNE